MSPDYGAGDAGGARSGGERAHAAAKLAMTLLGDYWFGAAEPVPSSVLVAVLG
jgi:hypothetical protein